METVTAIATVGLLIVTGIYAWLTHRLSEHAKASSASARDSAQHSEAAAAAAERSAAAAEASLDISFEVSAVATTSRTIVHLVSKRANLFVHQVQLKLIVVPRSTGEIYEVEGATTIGKGPIFLHAGEQTFAVIDREIEVGSVLMGQALVDYSLDETGTKRQRLVSVGNVAVETLDAS